MKKSSLLVCVTALTLLTTFAIAGAAGAQSARRHSAPPFSGASDAVFVQTDNLLGNQVVAYRRTPQGTLYKEGVYATGGLGGQLQGAVVDYLASQGSLVYAAADDLLLAVNAGSNTVSAFSVNGDRLQLRQILFSGGAFPVSIAVHGDLVYVLNAENGGSVQGFRIVFGALLPIFGSNRALGLNPTATPQFVNTPGQVAFSPDGTQLLVTTKANGNDIDVFAVFGDGLLSRAPVVNSEPTAVPFAVTFDSEGHLVVAEAGTNALATFSLEPDGTLSAIASLGTGESATCWVTASDGYFYASNAGSGNVSRFSDNAAGDLTLASPPTMTHPGTVDSAASSGGAFLYVQTGGEGIVDEFSVSSSGALSEIGWVTVPDAVGGEGIVAF